METIVSAIEVGMNEETEFRTGSMSSHPIHFRVCHADRIL